VLLLIMHGGLLGVFASVDIFYFYFFHELALIPTFIMVGIWGGRDRNYAAMKLTIYLTAGAMLSLLGLIALYVKSGANSFDLIELKDAIAAGGLRGSTQNWIGGLLLLGFGTLVSLWPLHTWAPLGYGAAPSSAAMLHAGVLKKFGLYGLIQIAIPLIPLGLQHWAWKLALLAAFGNVLVVGFVTMAQRDLKQMLGYSSVMHMGYCFLGIACLSTIGTGGVVLLMVAHGLSVALLFLLATSIHHRTHTFDLSEMGGLAQKTPVLAAFFVAATMASIGLPGFANFWGELTVFVAAVEILARPDRRGRRRHDHLGHLRPARHGPGVLRARQRTAPTRPRAACSGRPATGARNCRRSSCSPRCSSSASTPRPFRSPWIRR
jgi:NADH-quinone oxidoreductase subunit M